MSDVELASAPRDEVVSKWVPIIDAYERATEKWNKRSIKIIKRYKDDRNARESTASRYNILWSNIETLKPALFAKTPKAEVERRFKDKDPVGRVASEVLERCLDYCLEQHSFGSTMRQGVLDYLLCGRGTAWARYIPHMRDMDVMGTPETRDDGVQLTDDAEIQGQDDETPEAIQEVFYEEAVPDYVHWQDFGHTDARTWEEVTGVWRKVYLTRNQCKERFGDEIGKEIPLDFTPKGLDNEGVGDATKKATIYEIWDRDSHKAIWLSKHYPKKCDERDDPLKLDKFFPCPRPLYATMANDSLIPVPDYVEYQDQANELDELTGRISAITRAIKVAGVYDASAQGVQRLLAEGVENELIPVDQWAMFAEKGGLQGVMDLLPIQEIAQTLLHLYEARTQVKNDLYEITGMADIIRGSTNAQETATAQKIKSNFVTMRLDERQREVQRYTRNVVEILGQIIAGHFSLDTIRKMSGVQLMTNQEKQQVQMQMQQQAQMQAQQAQQQPMQPGQPPQQPQPPQLPPAVAEAMKEPSWEDVYALLQDETARCFRIDIETDSTIAGDEDQDKQDAVEFMGTVGKFMEQLGQTPPGMQPVMGQMLLFVVRRFAAGKNLESQIETLVEDMTKAAKAPPKPPQPDPTKMAEIQAKEKMHQQSTQADQQNAAADRQADMQMAKFQAALDQQAEQNRLQSEQQAEAMRQHMEGQRVAMDSEREGQQQASQAMQDQMFEMFKLKLQEATKVLVAEISAKASVDVAAESAAAQTYTQAEGS